MKRFVIFVLTLALALNCMAFTAVADEEGGSGGDNTPTYTQIDASIELLSVNNAYPTSNVTVSAGGSFVVAFRINTPYYGGRYEATVSGADFSMDGSSASRIGTNYSGEVIYVPIRISSTAKTERKSVTLNVRYTLSTGEVTLSQDINVNVVGMSEVEEPEQLETYADMSITSAPEGVVAAGSSFDIGFTTSLSNIYKVGDYTHTPDVRGTVTVEGEGFSLAGSLAEQEISEGAETISVKADKSLTSGRKQVTVKVTFMVDEKSFTASRAVNVDIENDTEEEEVDESNEKATFSLTKASIPEGKGKSKLSTNLTLEFKNTSAYEAYGVSIKLTGFNDTVLLNTFTDTVDIGSVLPGKTCSASFPIKFAEYIPAQTTLTATATYSTGAGEESKDYTVYLQMTEKKKEDEKEDVAEDEAKLKPKVIVSSYSVEANNENNEILSGEEFTLKITLKNTSLDTDLQNMTVKVTPAMGNSASSGNNTSTLSGPAFSIVDGTSSFYTETFEKDSTKEYSIKLKCTASAGAGTYPVQVSFDFQYLRGKTYESSSDSELTINLPVSQPIKFDLMEWEPPTECGPDGVEISFQYFNKSKNPMTALGIGVEGDFTMPTQYPGSLGASSYDYFSGTITPVDPTAVGQTKQAILFFTFEDSAGAEQKIEYPFDVTITETSTMGGGDMGDMGMGMGMGMGADNMMPVDPNMTYDEFGNPVMAEDVEQSAGLPLWAKIAIPAAAALAVIIIIVVIVKKVKAKKAALDDED